MRIAIIENNIIATNTIRKKLVESLILQGHEVTILSTGTDEAMLLASQNGFRVVDVKASNQSPADVLNYLRNLYKSLKTLQAEVCLTYTIRPAIWGNMVTRLLRIPTITNITGIGPLFEQKNMAYRFARILYKFVLRKTNRIFFQNEDDMKLFLRKKFVQKDRAEKIPGSGIDYEYYRPMERKPEGKFVFLFISRLIKDKGILEFVEAARLLKHRLPNAVFRVVGPVWQQNLKDNTVTTGEIERWTSEGIIDYRGEVSDVRPEIAKADCIVLPSYREGSSNVLLEASSMEKPCITCDTTGCREIVDDGVTGYLCKVRDAADLSEKMFMMYNLNDASRQKMGENARKKVIREYDKKIVIDAYHRAIEKIKSSPWQQ